MALVGFINTWQAHVNEEHQKTSFVSPNGNITAHSTHNFNTHLDTEPINAAEQFLATLSNLNKLLFQHKTVSELMKSLKCRTKRSVTVYFSPAFSVMFKQKYIHFDLPAYLDTVRTLGCQFLCDSPKHWKQNLCLQSWLFVFLLSQQRSDHVTQAVLAGFRVSPGDFLPVWSCTVHWSTSKFLCEMPADLGQSYALNYMNL